MKHVCAGCDAVVVVVDPKRPCDNCGVTCAVPVDVDDPNCPMPDAGGLGDGYAPGFEPGGPLRGDS